VTEEDLVHRLRAAVEEAAQALKQTAPARDWLDEVSDPAGDALKTDEAAHIAGVSVDTVRRRAEAAVNTSRPLGILLAGSVWLFSKRRLLDMIEAREGRPARLEAESRARKSVDLRSRPQHSA
jgi:hypothetical protein